MNRTTILLLFPVAFLGFACERHSAESLPSHGSHPVAHEAASGSHAPAHPEPAKTGAKKEKAPAAQGEAPKFFEGAPAK